MGMVSLSSHTLDVLVCGNKPAVSTACIRPSGLSEGDDSIATGSRIATVMDSIAAGSPSVTDAIGSGSPSVIDTVAAAGSPSVIDVSLQGRPQEEECFRPWLVAFYLRQERSNLYFYIHAL